MADDEVGAERERARREPADQHERDRQPAAQACQARIGCRTGRHDPIVAGAGNTPTTGV